MVNLSQAVEAGAKRVSVPELKTRLGGVKLDDAKTAVENAINETKEQIGQEILAQYNKPIVYESYNKRVLTYPEENGIRVKTYLKDKEGEFYLSKYEHTTPKGRYTVDYNEQKQVSHTRIDSPILGIRDRDYVNGVHVVRKTPEQMFEMEANYLKTRGRAVSQSNNSNSILCGANEKCYVTTYEDGSYMYTYVTTEEEPLRTQIRFNNDSWMDKNLKTNVSKYTRKVSGGKNSIDRKFVSDFAYHQNPETGEKSVVTISKESDDFGRKLVSMDFNFAPSTKIKNASIKYMQPERDANGSFSNAKILSGSFESERLGKMELKYGKIYQNGKELTREELSAMRDSSMIDKDCYSIGNSDFELMLKSEMENNGIPKELIYDGSGNWINL